LLGRPQKYAGLPVQSGRVKAGLYRQLRQEPWGWLLKLPLQRLHLPSWPRHAFMRPGKRRRGCEN